MAKLSQIDQACKYLDLPKGYLPTIRISHIFIDINLDEIVSCLRTSSDEYAQTICALYDRLPTPSRAVIDVDFLIGAAHIKDPHKVAGLITESYSRVKTMESSLAAAKASPELMRKAGELGKLPDGFNHSKMVLQASGVVSQPKTQVGGISYNLTKIDNSKNLNVTIPAQHGIVNEVSDILGKLPVIQNVSPAKDSGEDSSHRTG
jgi:hypothetical protein